MLPPTRVGNPPAVKISPVKRSRRSFPVRPGDGHNRPRQKLRRQFNLADHGLAHGPRLHQHRRIHGDPRAHHNQILPAKRALAVPAGLDRDAVIEQRRESHCAAHLHSWCRKP